MLRRSSRLRSEGASHSLAFNPVNHSLKHNLYKQILECLSKRDWDQAEYLLTQLGAHFKDDYKARYKFRHSLLPLCPTEVVRDFWTHVMGPQALNKLMEHMAMEATNALSLAGLELGEDFSFGITPNGDKVLYVSPKAHRKLNEHFSPAHLSTLRLLLPRTSNDQCTPLHDGSGSSPSLDR